MNPWKRISATYAYILIFNLVYLCEVLFSYFSGRGSFLNISPQILVFLGGTLKPLIMDGQYFRIFTSLFLHGGLLHLALNCMAMIYASKVLESLIPRSWIFLIFLISGAAGNVFSLYFKEENIVGIGASGGILGLFAAGATILIAHHRLKITNPLTRSLIQVLIFSLIPIISGVDYTAHLGGAIIGVGLTLIMIPFLRSSLSPHLKVGVAIFGGTCLTIYTLYGFYLLIPARIMLSKLTLHT